MIAPNGPEGAVSGPPSLSGGEAAASRLRAALEFAGSADWSP
jgi:hypothetical protein